MMRISDGSRPIAIIEGIVNTRSDSAIPIPDRACRIPTKASDAQVLADVAAERGAGKVVVRAEVVLPDSCPKSISAESPTRIDRHALAIPGVDAECGWDVSFRQVGGTTSRPCVDELPQLTSWHDEHLATHSLESGRRSGDG